MMSPTQPIPLADSLALELLNTVVAVQGELRDLLQSDADVVRWLEAAGFAVEGTALEGEALLEEARRLREQIRSLLLARKSGDAADPEALQALNAWLREAASWPELMTRDDGSFGLRRIGSGGGLARVAEAAADLLAGGDLELVKRCEDASCVLWFYDRTKSHHRRWCSMTTCGNRNKVAAYRKRRAE